VDFFRYLNSEQLELCELIIDRQLSPQVFDVELNTNQKHILRSIPNTNFFIKEIAEFPYLYRARQVIEAFKR
jgi:hypothetical protein